MTFNSLESISPIDGRYRSKMLPLVDYFSEKAFFKYRIYVEICYFIYLCRKVKIPQLKEFELHKIKEIKTIYSTFSLADAERIKEIENKTNHDVKAIEYFIKEKFDQLGLSAFKEFIHFGLTSQDINNTAIPLSLKECLENVYIPTLQKIINFLSLAAHKWLEVPMLSRTHGQPASPTIVGKEFMIFVVRLEEQLQVLKNIPYTAKLGGATGNLNAHYVAYPQENWQELMTYFIQNQLGLKRSYPTTQIDHYDHLAALFDGLKRINTILIDLCRDIWQYISMNYFKQTTKKSEIGSSAMPHKINPIDFENAEGNLGVANAILEHMSAKLPISRLQRDLTDSTVLRNVGVPIAHSYQALLSIEKGVSKIEINKKQIHKDLQNNWVVVAEAIQTILRKEGYHEPYEKLKELTRTGDTVTEDSIKHFIQSLNVSPRVKKEMMNISPFNYTGKYIEKP